MWMVGVHRIRSTFLQGGGKGGPRNGGGSREAEKPNSRAKPRSREAEKPNSRAKPRSREAEKPNSRAKPRSREAEFPDVTVHTSHMSNRVM